MRGCASDEAHDRRRLEAHVGDSPSRSRRAHGDGRSRPHGFAVRRSAQSRGAHARTFSVFDFVQHRRRLGRGAKRGASERALWKNRRHGGRARVRHRPRRHRASRSSSARSEPRARDRRKRRHARDRYGREAETSSRAERARFRVVVAPVDARRMERDARDVPIGFAPGGLASLRSVRRDARSAKLRANAQERRQQRRARNGCAPRDPLEAQRLQRAPRFERRVQRDGRRAARRDLRRSRRARLRRRRARTRASPSASARSKAKALRANGFCIGTR